MPDAAIGLNAVIVAVTEEVPRILTVRREPPGGGPAEDALPFRSPGGPRPTARSTAGLRRWVREQTGLELGYVEQLYTFGDRNRDPRESHGGPRLVSVAYLALVREVSVSGGARWRDWYDFFPWEDWRDGPARGARPRDRPRRWRRGPPRPASRASGRSGGERSEIVFGLGGVGWDGERVLERYEILYEAGLVPEARRDVIERGIERGEKETLPPETPEPPLGRPMSLDHRRILATALGRLRGKLKYRPVVFELLPPTFTLLQLQRVVEALSGVRLPQAELPATGGERRPRRGHRPSGCGDGGGAPAELFVFRREVLRERPRAGSGVARRAALRRQSLDKPIYSSLV